MAYTSAAFFDALNGLTIGNTPWLLSIVPLVIAVLVTFAITRNMKRAAILFLPVSLGLNVAQIQVGVLPIAIGSILFALNAFSLSGFSQAITAGYETVSTTARSIYTGSLGYETRSKRRAMQREYDVLDATRDDSMGLSKLKARLELERTASTLDAKNRTRNLLKEGARIAQRQDAPRAIDHAIWGAKHRIRTEYQKQKSYTKEDRQMMRRLGLWEELKKIQQKKYERRRMKELGIKIE